MFLCKLTLSAVMLAAAGKAHDPAEELRPGPEVQASSSAPAPAPEKPAEPPVKVRRLEVKSKSPALGGGGKAQVLTSAADVEKLAGKKAAEEVAALVDFAKEDVAFVGWESAGPPFGILEHEVKGKEKERLVEFYVKEPVLKAGEARGLALKLGADFFAVPKGMSVKFADKR